MAPHIDSSARSSHQLEIVDFDVARTDELVRMWRESFEFGVGVVDPHPIEDQREHFTTSVVIIARGFEPTWQLDDVKYEWLDKQE